MSYLSFSKRIASYLANKTKVSNNDEKVIAYAIEVIVITLADIVLSLALGYALGVFLGTLICLLTVAAFRYTAGGAHSASLWRCALITIFVFPILALLSQCLLGMGITSIKLFSFLSMIIGLLAIALLAPVDSKSAPILSLERRKKLKVISLIIISFITVIVFVLLFKSKQVYTSYLVICFDLSVLWVSFILSHVGHKFMQTIDNIRLPWGKGGDYNDEKN